MAGVENDLIKTLLRFLNLTPAAFMVAFFRKGQPSVRGHKFITSLGHNFRSVQYDRKICLVL